MDSTHLAGFFTEEDMVWMRVSGFLLNVRRSMPACLDEMRASSLEQIIALTLVGSTEAGFQMLKFCKAEG
jgi:hypothetical protein